MNEEAEYYARIHQRKPLRDVNECAACNGARYVRYERPAGHWMFGAIRPCPVCSPQSADGPFDMSRKL